MAKAKLIVLKNARNWTSTKLDTWYKHLSLSFLHGAFMMLYITSYSFASRLIPSDSNIDSRAPRSIHLFEIP